MNTVQPQLRHERGVVTVMAILWVSIFTLAVLSTATLVSSAGMQMSASSYNSERTFYAAEAGLNQGLYRLAYDLTQGTFCTDFVGTSIACNAAGDKVTVATSADVTNPFLLNINSKAEDSTGKVRTVEIAVGTSSFGGVQGAVIVGTAGSLDMDPEAKVYGNVYSNGQVTGKTQGNKQSTIYGEVRSTGAGGLINNIKIYEDTSSGTNPHGKDAYSHIIQDSKVIDGSAYYHDASTFINSEVRGHNCPGNGCNPNSPDLGSIVFPPEKLQLYINDDLKVRANAGTKYGCPGNAGLTISAPQTLGPAWICGNLKINLKNKETLTLTGPVWVDGNIEFKEANPIVQPDFSYGPKSEGIVATGTITMNKPNVGIYGACLIAGCDPTQLNTTNVFSFVIVASLEQNISPAMTVKNNGNGALFYAPNGKLELVNGLGLKNVTGKFVHLNNNVEIIYDPNLSYITLQGSNSHVITLGKWKEK